MSPKLTAPFGALFLLAGCAHSPEGISAAYVSPAVYAPLSCAQIASERTTVDARLATASTSQENIHAGDIFGVALLGLPLGSWIGGSHEAEVAQLKGQHIALDSAAQGCS